MSSYYAVQSYTLGNKGLLIEESPVVVRDRAQAERTAARLAEKSAGAVAFFRDANDFDEFAAPRFLAAFGQVPDHVRMDMEVPY